MKELSKRRVVVVGSLNMDLVASVPHLPRTGETVMAHRLEKKFGGKGANQAVAAARMGAKVSFIGCLGFDADGRAYRQRLIAEGIEVSCTRLVRGAMTGSALIGVDERGENSIIVAPAANSTTSPAQMRRHRRTIEQAEVLLVQLEVPMDAVIESIRIANRAGVAVVLNPSPYQPDFPWGEVELDYAIVNETEFALLMGMRSGEISRKQNLCFDRLVRIGVKNLIVTQGKRATVCLEREGKRLSRVRTIPVRPVDTVGAGDAFAGSLASGLARGESLESALVEANAAGGLATLKIGAQESLPVRSKVRRWIRDQ